MRPRSFLLACSLLLAALAPASCTATAVDAPELPLLPDSGDFVPMDAGPPDAGEDAATDAADAAAPGLVVGAPTGPRTSELGGKVSFTVRLATRPTADVIVPLSVSAPGEAALSTSSLAFTSSSWSTPQTVTVTGLDDDVADGDRPYSVTLGQIASADPAYAGLDPPDVALTNDDDDTPGIELSAPTGTQTTEAGGAVTFTIVLRSKPTANVTIPLGVSNPDEATVSPAQITFTPTDWSTPQTVTVTGKDDPVDDGNAAFSVVTGSAISADPSYAGRNPPDVALTNVDDDTAAVVVSAPSGTRTTEAGGAVTFTVRLATRPAADVMIPLSVTVPAEAEVAPAALTFSAGDWSVPKLVTVLGKDDDVDDGDQPFVVVLGAAASADPLYQGKNAADIALTNDDDDVAGFLVSPQSTTTTEAGGKAIVHVTLTSRPTAAVTIPLSTNKPAEATVVASLVIQPADWAAANVIEVTGVDDGLDDGDQAFSLVLGATTSLDPLYAGKDLADVAMVNLDRVRDGSSQANAARTCKSLHDTFPALGDGLYWVNPDGGATANAFRVTCDMTLDGGGWTKIGSGAFWLAVDNALPAGTMMSAARLSLLRAPSSHLYRAGSGASRLFVQDLTPAFAPPSPYWRTDAASVKCATAYAAVTGNTMATTATRAVACDAKAVGQHTCVASDGWLLFHAGDTYNVDGNHPCAFGAGETPTAGALLDLWLR